MKKAILPLVILTSVLASCGQQTDSTQAQTPKQPEHVASLSLEMVGANLKTVDADSLQSQSVEGVRVRHTRSFSNGDKIVYITVNGEVVDGDLILGDEKALKKALDDYQAQLDGKLKPQGAMTNRCTARLWFGGCVGTWEGVAWPKSSDGITHVKYETLNLGSYANNEVRTAMNNIEAASNFKIRFEEDNNYYSRIFFTSDNSGCWSRLGWQQNRQQLNLGPGCQFSGTATHELLHALGMMHEHQRPERDNYITLNSNNLTQRAQDNFWQYWIDDYAYGQNTAYDYSSIMHYPQYTTDTNFVNDTSQPMFYLTQNYSGVVGQRDQMSALDKVALNLRYGN